jgi:hypothetical protein
LNIPYVSFQEQDTEKDEDEVSITHLLIFQMSIEEDSSNEKGSAH